MKIDQSLILRLEELARLELSETERHQIQQDLENIIQMVDKLQEVDTTGVAPLIYLSEERNVLRADEVKNEIDRTSALNNAPSTDGKFFLVPKMIKKS